MTPIGAGTWRAARAGADVALTAAELVLAGAPAAYACTRPPGHHVTRRAYGGCCYLNNAAIAAERLRAALGGPVALLDLDAHHGNGAQAIFYADGDVRTGSVHVDPARGLVPALPRLRGRGRHARGPRREPQPPARARHGRRRLGRRGGGPGGVGRRRPRARRRARRRRRGRRPREPAGGHASAASARPAARSARSACRPSSCRRAATTSAAIGALVLAALEGIHEGQQEVDGG